MTDWTRRLHHDERGVALVESLVSSVLLGIALMFLVGSLSTFAIASRGAEDRAIGQAIARAQVARIVAAPYQAAGDYSAYYEALPTGFSRTIVVNWWNGVSAWTATPNALGLERLVLTINQGGKTLTSIDFVTSSR